MTLRGGTSSGSVRAWRRYFTLTSIDGVVELMRDMFISCGEVLLDEQNSLKQLQNADVKTFKSETNGCDSSTSSAFKEPNLAFVSIVLGYIENHLTVGTLEESDSSKIKHFHHNILTRRKCSPAQTNSRSRSSSLNKISQSPLAVHVETSEENLSTPTQNDQAKVDKHSNCSPISQLSELSTVDTPQTNSTSGQGDFSVSTPRRNVRRFRSNRRGRQRHESCMSGSGDSAISDHSCTPKNEPLEIITDVAPLGKRRRFSDSTLPNPLFPSLTFDEVERLYQEFYNLITKSPILRPYMDTTVDLGATKLLSKRCASRSLIHSVCKVLWTRMAASRGKERLTHTQTIYSFLTTGILDSFGLAYTVAAACQLLGYEDVDLALSEDHGWIEFGPPDARQTADVASWVQETHISSVTPVQCSGVPTASPESPHQSSDHPSSTERRPTLENEMNPPPIRIPPLTHSWLYVNGYPVVCRPRILAVAAAIAAIQPGASVSALTQAPISAPLAYGAQSPNLSLSSGDLVTPTGLVRHLSSASAISLQLVTLKHKLLWLCFDAGRLSRYPLGLTNLADLEDAFPTMSRLATYLNLFSHCSYTNSSSTSPKSKIGKINILHTSLPDTVQLTLALYKQAVLVNQHYYANQHVYPYTCLAGCLYRHDDQHGALFNWAEAARVIGQYDHTSEDWEIYRELLEIATHLMPQMFRSAAENSRSCSEGLLDTDPDGCIYQLNNILDDPYCLSYLLAFYDHLCLWEEGSPVPVLHVGWVDKLMVNLTRFSQRARRHLSLSVATSIHKEEQDDSDDVKNDTFHSPVLNHSTSKSNRWITDSMYSTNEISLPKRSHRIRPNQLDSIPRSVKEENRLKCIASPYSHSPVVVTKSASLREHLNVDIPTSFTKNNEEDTVPPTESFQTNVDAKSNIQSKKGCKRRNTKLNKVSPVNNSSKLVGEKLSHDDFSYKNVTTTTTNNNNTNNNNNNNSDNNDNNTLIPEQTISIEKSFESPMINIDLHSDLDANQDQLLDIEDQDGSPSPPSLVDFPNHDDLLASLAEACDHRLLNPAFLWGTEPNSPFLPPNIAPEEAFHRLITILENKSCSITSSCTTTTTATTVAASITTNNIHTNHDNNNNSSQFSFSHIFPTPPNSGSFIGSLDIVTNDDTLNAVHRNENNHDNNSDLDGSKSNSTLISPVPTDQMERKLSAVQISVPLPPSSPPSKSNLDCDNSKTTNEELFISTNFVDTIDDFDLLNNIPNELINSMNDLLPNHSIPDTNSINSCDFFDLVLHSQTSVNSSDHQLEVKTNFEKNSTQSSLQMDSVNSMKKFSNFNANLTLYSIKMISIVDLLRAQRLNSSAIKLALTAQSQVCVRRTYSNSVYAN